MKKKLQKFRREGVTAGDYTLCKAGNHRGAKIITRDGGEPPRPGEGSALSH
jgi:hypothetical protein